MIRHDEHLPDEDLAYLEEGDADFNDYVGAVFVTRKGAVRAGQGDLGIIPGSAGAKSFIARGKGSIESFCNCSHGTGRTMSRKAA